jgi:hypothetical protein
MPQEAPFDQTSAVAGRVLRTWWFWLFLIVIVWSGLFLVGRVTRLENERFQAELAQNASNQLAESLMVISNQLHAQLSVTASNQLRRGFADLSNRLASGLSQAQIRAAIVSSASRQATQTVLAALSPALSNLQARLDRDETRLNAVTNPAPVAPVVIAATQPPPAPKATTPAGISFYSQSIARRGSGYILTAVFKKTGDGPLGALRFDVGAFNQMPARINGVDVACDAAPSVERAVVTGGLEAIIGFTPAAGADPAFSLSLTGPSVIQITCDALPDPVTVPVLANVPGSVGAPTTQ